MITIDPVTMRTAAQLLNFAGTSEVAKSFAESQLEGAVAMYNLLARGRVAYLADEVGLGKTFVVLGTVGLLRHYHPHLRVLYIVPKENLQRKWRKELRNFTVNNWRVLDHRVKSFQGTPIAEPVLCENLLDLCREAALDANRDFLLRLSSFSLPLSQREGGGKAWQDKAELLRQAFPGLAEAALDVDGRSSNAPDQFKDKFAAAVNAILPHFDLLVLDEGHNLKRGFQKDQGAARNRLLAYVLGTKQCGHIGRPLRPRVDRAIILSATPVDDSFQDLYNQLDLLGLADGFTDLCDDDDTKAKGAAAACLVRRLTQITIGGKRHTRNMYRREWRGGGVQKHDAPLQIPDDCQRLIVALMQKKVADLLAEQGRERHTRFSRSFQIGMLASFESFGRTAKLAGEEATFDQSEQSENACERQGIDTSTVNGIAASYREHFDDSLPHPKMNAVVDEVWQAFLKGRKTLIFVRRIHSVPEIVEKLTKKYNDWLMGHIREELKELPEADQEALDRAFECYGRDRKGFYSRDAVDSFVGTPQLGTEEDLLSPIRSEEAELGGFESFFSWFFRGKGPDRILSGASLSRNRLEKPGAVLSTLFEDNWLLWLLGYPTEPLKEMARLAGASPDELASRLRADAAAIHPSGRTAKRHVFLAYQQAGLGWLAQQRTDSALADKARIILEKQQKSVSSRDRRSERRGFPGPHRYLGLRTFFTQLAQRKDLCQELWHLPPSGAFEKDFVEREQRRLLLSSAMRLGHPMVDLWLSYAKLAKSLAPGKLDETESMDGEPDGSEVALDVAMAAELVDLLDRQRTAAELPVGPTSFSELRRLAKDFPLLLDVNFHEMRDRPLSEVPRYLADQLGQQQPVAGMHGGVLRRTVTQFRMPGYPYVLVTTDVLQEGEDLHTYCDRIVHYGISWTPSATEQRIGRVDRIGSLVQRRLEGQTEPREEDYLQVYFPYLADTYEYVQVGVVFRRLNRFMEMLHDFRLLRTDHGSEVEVTRQIHEKAVDVFNAFREPLKSGFEIAEDLKPKEPMKPLMQPANDRILAHFRDLKDRLTARFWIDGHEVDEYRYTGKAFICAGQLAPADQKGSCSGVRQQPFSLALRTTYGGLLLLRCTSGLGPVYGEEEVADVLRMQRNYPHLKICAVADDVPDSYRLFAQKDLLFSPKTTQYEELEHAFATMLASVDRLEDAMYEGKDHTEAELALDNEDEEADRNGSD